MSSPQGSRLDSYAPAGYAILAGLFAFALYARTLAPGLTWAHDGADGGDFLAAALTHGVPHPPGYPTYILLLRATLAVLPGEPARAGNWLSAFCAALAVALMADLARRMLGRSRWGGWPALAATLAWAASPTLWSQAVITEVYTLNALFVVLVFWLLWRWRESGRSRGPGQAGPGWPAALGLAWGLGLGNHLSLALMLPGVAAWFWTDRASWPRRRDIVLPVCLTMAGVLLGLGVYAYLPLAARAVPPVNWGDPDVSARFWWLVTGRLYASLVFGLPASWLPQRVLAWAADALRQFGPWGAVLAATGLWKLEVAERGLWRLTLLVAAACSLYAIGYNSGDSYLYLLPVWAMATLWLAAGIEQIRQFVAAKIAGRREPLRQAVLGLIAAVLVLLPAVSVARFWTDIDLSQERSAQEFITGALSAAEPNAVILTSREGPTFALWYAVYGLQRRPDLVPLNANLYDLPWYRETLAAHTNLWTDLPDPTAWPALEKLLPEIAARRPLYRAGQVDADLRGFGEQATGSLVRLMPLK